MKRSTQVLLTLMIPAVAAFGCESAKKPPVAKSDCSRPAKPGEPPKAEVCQDPSTASQTARSGSYFPSIWYWGSGSRSYGNAGVQSAPSPSAGFTPTSPSRPAGAPSSVTSGGFGRTGSSLSSSS
ncbi:MAG: hypothetical protein ACKOAU_20825 [Pirellula sp.]|jgi:hypothetical protein